MPRSGINLYVGARAENKKAWSSDAPAPRARAGETGRSLIISNGPFYGPHGPDGTYLVLLRMGFAVPPPSLAGR